MAKQHDELRSRLAAVSIDDIDAVHALYLDASAMFLNDHRWNSPNHVVAAEVARRAERAMGLAIRAAQARGQVLAVGGTLRHTPNAAPVSKYLSRGGQSTRVYVMADVNEEVFEEALSQASKNGGATWPAMVRLFEQLKEGVRPAPSPEPAVTKKTRPTTRGRRTMEDMAIQINAIALGVQDISPAEVDKVAMEHLVEQVRGDLGVIRGFLRRVMDQ